MTFESSRFVKVFTSHNQEYDSIRMNTIRIRYRAKRDASHFKVVISEIMWKKACSNILLLVIVENWRCAKV